MSEGQVALLGVAVDASPAQAGFDQVAASGEQAFTRVEKASDKAGKSLGNNLGRGASDGADTVDRATRSMEQSIQRQIAAFTAGAKNSSDYQRELAKLRGIEITPEIEKLLQQLDAVQPKQLAATEAVKKFTPALNEMGMSAKATANAMRGVPAQFTDIITSLQGGQRPLSVLLQQGGQLKDMFGGVGNAARAMGTYVAGLLTPFTVAAAAAGTLAYAYYSGAQESREYTKALILSGNAAGTTAGQLQAMADNLSKATGATVGVAADTLAVFVTNGGIASTSLEKYAATAIRMQKATGQAIDETAKQFAALAKDPLNASLKLNESTKFLTLSVYEQIRALMQRGDIEQAGAVAQDAYAAAENSRTKGLKENLGTLESAFKIASDAAKGFWDSVLDVGRTESIDQKIKAIKDQLKTFADLRANDPRGAGLSELDKNEEKKLKEKLAVLTHISDTERDYAKFQADNAKQAELKSKWDDKVAQSLTSEAKALLEVKKLRGEYNALTATGVDVPKSDLDKQIAAIMRPTNDAITSASGAALVSAAQGNAKRVGDYYKNELEHFRMSTADFIQKMADLQRASLQAERSAIAATDPQDTAGKIAKAAKLKELDAQIADITRQTGQSMEDAATKASDTITKMSAAMGKSLDPLALAGEQFTANWGEQLRRFAADGNQAGLDAGGKLWQALAGQSNFDAAKQRFDALFSDFQAKLEAVKQTAKDGGLFSNVDAAIRAKEISEQLTPAIEAARAEMEKTAGTSLVNQKTVTDATTAMEKVGNSVKASFGKISDEINKDLTDALMRAFDSGKDFASAMRDAIVTAFKSMVLQPTVSLLLNPVAQGITGALMGGSAAASGSAVGTAVNTANTANLLSGLGSWFTDFKMASTNAVYELGGTLTKIGAEKMGSLVTANATAIGNFVNVAGYAINAISAIDAASRGKWGAAIGTGLGAAFFGPIGGAVGGAIGGWLDSAFGGGHEYTTGAGLTGTFGKSGFSGRNYQTWRNDGSSGFLGIGGSGSSSGTNYSGLDAATASGLSQGFMSLQAASSIMALSLGLDAKKIISYSQDISVALGSDAAANKKAIEDMFNGVADNLALAVAPKIADFSKSGESASATLSRLASSITTTNQWLTILKQRLYSVSLAGADAASKLADAFGGLDKLAASSQTFYDLYYTNGEKVAANQKAMSDSLAVLGLALPSTKDQLKALALSMDLNTESGRAAYATLLQIAPQFSATADLAAQAAKDTATALIKAFSANGQLVPTLDAASLSLEGVQAGADIVVGAMTQIHASMLDVGSPVLTFSGTVASLSTELTGAQKSSLDLKDQIEALSGASNKAVIDFDGLTAALANADTTTFVEVIAQVFDALAVRVKSVVDTIGTERVAVREAALQIINPTGLSKQSIQAGIAGVNVSLPSNAALIAANATLAAANTAVDTQANKLTVAQADAAATKTVQADLVASVKTGISGIWALAAKYGLTLQANPGETGNTAQFSVNDKNQFVAQYSQIYGNASNFAPYKAEFYKAGGVRDQTYGQAAALNDLATKLADQNALVATLSDNTAVKATQAAAAQAAAKALLDYQKALQGFAIDASKSVSKLSNLRAETVKYYEAQKALADLMQTSAANLLSTVANYRFQQLSPEAQSASLQSQFATAYSMALSSQGDGNTLASYADKLNSTLGPLIDSLKATGQDNLINSFLAQAETIAKLLQDNAPQNYAADSLDMLSSIDATLAALDASSKSAEQVISDAVTAGSDRTAAGLYAVIAAITGKTVPAFATGGAYGGGLALVGENGPELINFNQPGQVYNASQTQGMFGSGGSVVAELQALRLQIESMSAETRSTAISSGRTAKILERVTPDGVSLQTVAA